MRKIVAIDIGGTNSRAALWQDGKIVERIATPSDGDDMAKTLTVFADFISKTAPEAVGVSMPGPADFKNGVMFHVPNLPNWRNRSVKDFLAPSCRGAPIVFENDANLMALAHHRKLGLPDSAVTQFYTVSTGLGAGLIIEGRIYTGGSGYAQEVAWVPASVVSEPNDLNPRSLEYFSAGGGLAKRARKHLGLNSTRELFDAAAKGNATAKRIIDEGIDALANFLAIVFATINPTHVVFDGAVSRHQTWYVEAAFARARELSAKEHGTALLSIGNLGDDAALIGAYHNALSVLNHQEK